MNPPALIAAQRNRIAAEVLELGETLFDAVLDTAIARSGAEKSEPLPEAELRTAAEEFFQALRVLVGLSEESGITMSQGSSSSDSTDRT